MSTPLRDVRFAVVDVETSGVSRERHHVLQVGVVVVDGDGNVLDRWSSLVRPRNRWFFKVGPTHVHGIRRRDVRSAPPAVQVMGDLAARLTGTRFVAHNVPFDLGFLRKTANSVGVELPIGQPVCTLRLSRALDPERALSHKLLDVCTRYGVALDRPHDALADAEATAAVLPHLLRAHGVQTADQLEGLPAPR